MFNIKAGQVLFKEGDYGNYFYIIKQGSFKLTLDNDEVKYFKEGDTFGEFALIHKNKRSGTVLCVEDAHIFCLAGTAFRELSQKLNQSNIKDRLYFLSLITIFSKNSVKFQKDLIIYNFIILHLL